MAALNERNHGVLLEPSAKKRTIIFAALLCLTLFPVFGDGKPARKRTPESFVPPGWTIIYKASGDLNGDGQADIVLLVDPPGDDAAERLTMILEARPDGGFVLAASAPEIALCRRCGGAFGDPGMDPEIKNSVLTIGNYGGTAWKWSETFEIKKLGAEYQLIGYESNSFHSLKECESTSLKYDPTTDDVLLSEEKMKGEECVQTDQHVVWKPRAPFLMKNRKEWDLPRFTTLWKEK